MYTFDTSFIVKGLVPPRRKKDDQIYQKQLNMHLIAKQYLSEVEKKKKGMFIPSLALIETAAVISRITGDEKEAREAVWFLQENAIKIYYDIELLDEAISTGIITKASGFDIIFLTVAKITETELLTDDKRMYKLSLESKMKTSLLRNLAPK